MKTRYSKFVLLLAFSSFLLIHSNLLFAEEFNTLTPKNAESWLKDRLAKLVKDPRIAGATVSVFARTTDRKHRILFSKNENAQVSIASNVKLITSSAALSLFGPEYRFKTEVFAIGRKGDSVDYLLVKAYGDPSLTRAELWKIADAIYETGVRKVKKGLLFDQSYFDQEKLAPLFETRDTDAYYRPPVGAFSIHENAVAIHVEGIKKGERARVSFYPRSDYFIVKNEVETLAKRRRSWVKIETKSVGKRLEVLLTGQVRQGYKGPYYRKRIDDPLQYAARSLRFILKRRGIKIQRNKIALKRYRESNEPLVRYYSKPLGTIVRRMNKVSSNFIAEQMLKILGAEVYGDPGTSEKGLKVLARYLKTLGIKNGSYLLKNASGLYDASGFSARQIVRVLEKSYQNFRFSSDYLASLPIAGVDGTLMHRFIGSGAEGYVRAKTGTLAEVVSISGFAGSKRRRHPIAFSILLTKIPQRRRSIRDARRVADEMVSALVAYLER